MTEQTGPQLVLALEDDQKHMHVRINSGDKLRAGIVFSAAELDHVIASLVQLRQQMQPAIPTQFADASALREIKGTHFDFGIDTDTGELIFSLRDAGLGWLTQRFDARLLERMLKIARSAAVTATKQ
jgi:hypothetical protein